MDKILESKIIGNKKIKQAKPFDGLERVLFSADVIGKGLKTSENLYK